MIVGFVEVKKEHSTDGRIGLDDIVDVYLYEKEQIMKVQITGERPQVLEDEGLSKITLQSPMGKAIFGKKVDDIVTYTIEGRASRRISPQKLTLKILSVERAFANENEKGTQPGDEE